MARPIAEPEIHLIPDGFVGHVVIRHGVAGGAPAEREGDSRLYRIPAGGVLETQAPANYGIREPAAMKFHYDGAARTPLPVHRTSSPAPLDETAILGGYQVRADFHYFVDTPRNAGRYQNPAIQPGERAEPDPATRSEALFRYAFYPILFSRSPIDEVDRVARVLMEGMTLAPTRNLLRDLVAEIRAELAAPSRRLRDMLGPNAQPEDVVSESDLREFLRRLTDRIAAALADA